MSLLQLYYKRQRITEKKDKLQKELDQAIKDLELVNYDIDERKKWDLNKNCKICDYEYKNPKNKIYHDRLHELFSYEKEKSKYKNVFNHKYKCALCDKVYYEGSDNINGLKHLIFKDKILKDNSSYFSDHQCGSKCDKLSRCKICDDTGTEYQPFVSRASRHYHMKVHHPKKKLKIKEPEVCPIVPKRKKRKLKIIEKKSDTETETEIETPTETETEIETEVEEPVIKDKWDLKREKNEAKIKQELEKQAQEEEEFIKKREEKLKKQKKYDHSYKGLCETWEYDIKLANIHNKLFCVYCETEKDISEMTKVRNNEDCCIDCEIDRAYLNPYDSQEEFTDYTTDATIQEPIEYEFQSRTHYLT